jgi:hypothetical protein
MITSQDARINAYERIHVKDVVQLALTHRQFAVGKVELLVSDGIMDVAIVSMFAIQQEHKRCWKMTRVVDGNLTVAPLANIMCSCIHADGGADAMSTVLKPLHAAAWHNI